MVRQANRWTPIALVSVLAAATAHAQTPSSLPPSVTAPPNTAAPSPGPAPSADPLGEPVVAPAKGEVEVDTRVADAKPADAKPAGEPAKPHGGGPMTVAGAFGKGVTLASEDERFTLNIRGRVQVQGLMVFDEGDAESPETRFAIRRARLVFQGNAWGKTLKYYIQLGFSNQDQEPDLRMPLRDATIIWTPHRDVGFRIGQMKVPFGKQRVTSSSALELVDRSIVIAELSLDRDVGVFAFSKDLLGLGSRLGYALGVFGGDGRNRLSTAWGVMPVARIELRPFGEVDEEFEGDLSRSAKPRLQIGVAAGYNWNTNRPRSTVGEPYKAARFDYRHLAADVLWKWSGLSLLGEIYWRGVNEKDETGTVSGAPLTEYARPSLGYFGQASFMVTDKLLVAGRYSRIEPRGATDPTFVAQNEAGGGLTYFFAEHNLKLQGDYFALFGDNGSPLVHQIRVQTQLYF